MHDVIFLINALFIYIPILVINRKGQSRKAFL